MQKNLFTLLAVIALVPAVAHGMRRGARSFNVGTISAISRNVVARPVVSQRLNVGADTLITRRAVSTAQQNNGASATFRSVPANFVSNPRQARTLQGIVQKSSITAKKITAKKASRFLKNQMQKHHMKDMADKSYKRKQAVRRAVCEFLLAELLMPKAQRKQSLFDSFRDSWWGAPLAIVCVIVGTGELLDYLYPIHIENNDN